MPRPEQQTDQQRNQQSAATKPDASLPEASRERNSDPRIIDLRTELEREHDAKIRLQEGINRELKRTGILPFGDIFTRAVTNPVRRIGRRLRG